MADFPLTPGADPPQVDPSQCRSLISVTVCFQAVQAADQESDYSPNPCHRRVDLDLDDDCPVAVPDLLTLPAAWGSCRWRRCGEPAGALIEPGRARASRAGIY